MSNFEMDDLNGVGRRLLEIRLSEPKSGIAAMVEPLHRAITELLAEPEIRLVMHADKVDEGELLKILTAVGFGLLSVGEGPKPTECEELQHAAEDDDDAAYRAGVGIVLLNGDNKVFVGHRIGETGSAGRPWQMPQGGIDGDETPLRAAFRELREEIGTDNVEVLAASVGWHRYDLPDGFDCAWRGRWKGQRQKWFVMRHLGRDADIDVATEHPEFTEWRWVPAPALPDLAVAFKRQVYLRLIADFADLIVPQDVNVDAPIATEGESS